MQDEAKNSAESAAQEVNQIIAYLTPYAGVLEAHARGLPVQVNDDLLAALLRGACFLSWAVVTAQQLKVDPAIPTDSGRVNGSH